MADTTRGLQDVRQAAAPECTLVASGGITSARRASKFIAAVIKDTFTGRLPLPYANTANQSVRTLCKVAETAPILDTLLAEEEDGREPEQLPQQTAPSANKQRMTNGRA